MRLFKDATKKLNIEAVVALGCFDGVHKAHAHVIGEAVRISQKKGVLSAVWCFSEPPRNFYSSKRVPLVCEPSEKARLIRTLGVDVMIEPDFTREIAGVTAREFIEKYLVGNLGAVHLVCGRNYTFGAKAEGNAECLEKLCREFGIGLSVVEDIMLDGVKISSTLVREAVKSGQCAYAARLLGRNFSLCFNIDTKNTDILDQGNRALSIDEKYLSLPRGEYEAVLHFGGRKRKANACIKEGKNGKELFILGDNANAFGRVRVEFCKKIK